MSFNIRHWNSSYSSLDDFENGDYKDEKHNWDDDKSDECSHHDFEYIDNDDTNDDDEKINNNDDDDNN